MHRTLATWNIKQFRLVLLLFFLALVIPTLFLILQAYSQLKWEAFHHYRQQAEELVSRIDRKYHELIQIESVRNFTDYTFLNIARDSRSNVLQRSPLAEFPVKSAIPGTIGYFQIDNFGRFTTPMLPPAGTSAIDAKNNYGISSDEQILRTKAHSKIYQILSANRLVEKQKIQISEQEPPVDRADSITPDVASLSEEQNTGISSNRPLLESQIMSSDSMISSQSAFDDLQTINKYRSNSAPQAYPKSIGRVEDLKLKKTYSQKSADNKLESRGTINAKQKPGLRKERNILPTEDKSAENERTSGKSDKSLPIKIFESEIDAFEFSILESGHFVLYRKVWREGQRYIQGMLIEPADFINGVIRSAFYETSVSNASNLAVAYQGNVLNALSSKASRRSYSSTNELHGTLLLQGRLSTTLDQLELIFSISNLPAGPGGTVVTWLSIILIFILSGGFYTLYHLGLKQINLARQQQDFVSAVSHELKTPLTSIRMYGEMLREGWAPEEKRKSYYDYIYNESERLTRLINNVLQLARIGRNELHIELHPTNIAQLIDVIRSKITSQAERAGFIININCNQHIEDTKININDDYFTQIMINLIDNAIKFSAGTEHKQIDIGCQMVGHKLQISVRDYGPGISKDQIKKIFQLFYRTENELTRKTTGTGIGLSLVKQLIQAMHGEIDVINMQPGVEFRITFQSDKAINLS